MRRISLLSGLIFLCAGGVAQANAALDEQLCKAAAKGPASAIAGLIKKGAMKDAICEEWEATPLQNAVQDDNLATMAALAAAGANVNAWSGGSDRYTALYYARSPEAMQFLIAHHANVTIASPKDKSTPLLWVSLGAAIADTDEDGDSSTKLAQMLIDAGADVNVVGDDGIGPLAMGISAYSKSFAQLLVDHGGNVNARNEFGVSVLNTVLATENTAKPEEQV
jgi:ankyrin repeat protein